MPAHDRTDATRPVDAAIGRIAASQHGVFSRAQALRSGATESLVDRRVGSGRWIRLHRGVYAIDGAPPSWRRILMAGCLAAGDDALASHRCAALLLDIPGVVGQPIPEITVPRGRAPRLVGVIVHESRRLPSVDVQRFDGIPVTSAARTLIDCAAIWPPPVIEEALDDVLRRGLVSLSRLRWRMREVAVAGRPGAAVLWKLVQARNPADPLPGSVLERRFLRQLRHGRLPEPVGQHRIRDAGHLIAIVDFAYPDARVAIEVDGYRYHSGRARWQRDLTRRNALTAPGWRVINVTADDIANRGGEVCLEIARALAIGRPT